MWLRCIIASGNYGNKTAFSLESSGLLAGVGNGNLYVLSFLKKTKLFFFPTVISASMVFICQEF